MSELTPEELAQLNEEMIAEGRTLYMAICETMAHLEAHTPGMFNALGMLVTDNVMSIGLSADEQLKEFDRWVSYTRQHLIECHKSGMDRIAEAMAQGHTEGHA